MIIKTNKKRWPFSHLPDFVNAPPKSFTGFRHLKKGLDSLMPLREE